MVEVAGTRTAHEKEWERPMEILWEEEMDKVKLSELLESKIYCDNSTPAAHQ